MISLDKAVLAKLDSKGHHFEIFVEPHLALDFRHGKGEIGNVVAANAVFKDAHTGDKVGEALLKQVFGTSDFNAVAAEIIRNGEVQLTTEMRHEMQQAAWKKIVATIARDAINPQTGLPHPPQRIETAMGEAKVHVDIFKKAEDQIEGVLKAIRPLIPISFETRQIAVRIPAEFTGSAYSALRSYKLLREEWQNDGKLAALVEIPAGLQPEFFDRMNKLTKGEVEIKITNRK